MRNEAALPLTSTGFGCKQLTTYIMSLCWLPCSLPALSSANVNASVTWTQPCAGVCYCFVCRPTSMFTFVLPTKLTFLSCANIYHAAYGNDICSVPAHKYCGMVRSQIFTVGFWGVLTPVKTSTLIMLHDGWYTSQFLSLLLLYSLQGYSLQATISSPGSLRTEMVVCAHTWMC